MIRRSFIGPMIFLLLVLSFCQTTAVGYEGLHTVLISDVSSGIEVALTSSLPKGGQITTFFNLSDHFSSECGNISDWRCNIEVVSIGHSTWFMFLSVEGAVSAMKLNLLESVLTNVETYDITWPVAGGLPCQPTAVIYYGSLPFTACLNHTDNVLWFVNVEVNINNLLSSKLDNDPGNSVTFLHSVPTQFIRDVSPRCPGALDPLFHVVFASGNVIYDYSYEESSIDEIEALSENCSRADSLAYYGGSTILVDCPDEIWERTDICDSIQIKTYSARVPVPCSTWDYVVYLVENTIIVPAFRGMPDRNISLPYNNTDHEECVMAESGIFIFLILQLENSTVVAIEILSNTWYPITYSSCTSAGQCFKPRVWEQRYLGFINGTYFLLKDLNCLTNPPIQEIKLTSFPIDAHVISGMDSPVYQCNVISPIPSGTLTKSTTAVGVSTGFSVLTTSTADVNVMSHTSVQAVITPTCTSTPLPSNMPPDVNPPQSSLTTTVITVVIPTAVILTVICFVIAITSVGYWKYKQKRQQNSPTPSQMELNEQRTSSASEDNSDSQRPSEDSNSHHNATISPSSTADSTSNLLAIQVEGDRTGPGDDSQCPSEGTSSYYRPVESDDEQPNLKPLGDDGATIDPAPATGPTTPEVSELVTFIQAGGDRTVPGDDSRQPNEGASAYHCPVESDDEQPNLKPLGDDGTIINPAPATGPTTPKASELVSDIQAGGDRSAPRDDFERPSESDDEQPHLKPLGDDSAVINPAPAIYAATDSEFVPIQVDINRPDTELLHQISTVTGHELLVPPENFHPEQHAYADLENDRNRHLDIAMQYNYF